jgi:hypothetical protein
MPAAEQQAAARLRERETPAPAKVAPAPPRAKGWIPPPPSVVYLSAARRGTETSIPQWDVNDPVSRTWARGGLTQSAEDGASFDAAQAAPLDPGPLGPPPPYQPILVPPKPRPAPVEMMPAPTGRPVEIRTAGELGPPPPYRPIVQAGAVFGRGPAPDLEPWRMTLATDAGPPDPAMPMVPIQPDMGHAPPHTRPEAATLPAPPPDRQSGLRLRPIADPAHPARHGAATAIGQAVMRMAHWVRWRVGRPGSVRQWKPPRSLARPHGES